MRARPPHARRAPRRLQCACAAAAGAAAAGSECRAAPVAGAGAGIASLAATLLGTPYHFGGADQAGFDCCGLTLYVHERLGIAIPRTAAEQQRGAQPVPLAELTPGDLVFFRIRARHVDHVGVYAGDGRFIHAPHAASP